MDDKEYVVVLPTPPEAEVLDILAKQQRLSRQALLRRALRALAARNGLWPPPHRLDNQQNTQREVDGG